MQYKEMMEEINSNKKNIKKVKKKYKVTKPVAKELKPCPFCDKDATVNHSLKESWYITCDNPKCLWVETPICTTKKQAVAIWNKRS